MHPASQRPTSGLLVEERVPCVGPSCRRAGLHRRYRRGHPAWRQSGGMDSLGARSGDRRTSACSRRRHAGPAAPARDRRDAGPRSRAAGDADVLDGPRALAAHLPCRSGQGAGRRRCRQCTGARGGPGNRRKGARGKAQPPRPGSRRGARCLARPRAAHAAERRHRLCRDPEERALRPARQPALSRATRAISTTARGMRSA